MFTQALGVKPSDKAVLGRVNRLYANAEMWPELLENLRFCVSIAENDQGACGAPDADRRGARRAHWASTTRRCRTTVKCSRHRPAERGALEAVRKIGESTRSSAS